MHFRRTRTWMSGLLALSLHVTGFAQTSPFVLIDSELTAREVTILSADETAITYREVDGPTAAIGTTNCAAMIAVGRTAARPGAVVLLSDGQRIPGRMISNPRPTEDVLVWNQPWLGRLEIPIDRVRAITLMSDHQPTPARDADVVQLINGDRWSGFIMALGDPIGIEVEVDGEVEEMLIPLDRVASVSMVAPTTPAKGRRIWLRDGTVIDVDDVMVGADRFVRLIGCSIAPGEESIQVQLDDIVAVRFQPGALRPLATLRPDRVEGPPTRFVIPRPVGLDRDAPLEMSRLDVRGPLVVRYVLPERASRFAAKAILPESSHEWGDYELIVRDDNHIVFRDRLNASHPKTSINVELRGSELSIELTPGENGPIQDRCILERAMLLVRD